MAFSDKILEKSIDPTVHQMLDRAEQAGIETVWDRYEKMLPECGFGELGVCCRNCNMGPCRISPFEDEGPQKGILRSHGRHHRGPQPHSNDRRRCGGPLRSRPRPGPHPAADRRGEKRRLRNQGRGQAGRPGQGVWHRRRRPHQGRNRPGSGQGRLRRIRQAGRPAPVYRAGRPRSGWTSGRRWASIPAASTAKSWRSCTAPTSAWTTTPST